MRYQDFAKNISFFEILQKEYKDPHFKTEEYANEIKLLASFPSIELLAKKLEEFPKIYDIVEEVFQMSRFSNVQIINFLFDTWKLNYLSEEELRSYSKTYIFYFENALPNNTFIKIYDKVDCDDSIARLKIAINLYTEKCIKNKELLHYHITNSVGSRLRISWYFISNLWLNTFLQWLDLEKYLKNKRNPIDSKMISGKYGSIRIKKILEENGFINGDKLVKSTTLSLNIDWLEESKFYFFTEKNLEWAIKRKDKKLKKFDFILVKNNTVFFLIETNYFSTNWTKIGINQWEYVDLYEDLKEIYPNIYFSWITDGNYWLSNEWKKRFENIKNNYFTEKYTLLNYSLFLNYISDIKNI